MRHADAGRRDPGGIVDNVAGDTETGQILHGVERTRPYRPDASGDLGAYLPRYRRRGEMFGP